MARPDLPILLITGYAGQALVNLELPDGVEVLRKPFELDEVGRRVRGLLSPKLDAPNREKHSD